MRTYWVLNTFYLNVYLGQLRWNCGKVIFKFLCKERPVSWLSHAPERQYLHSYIWMLSRCSYVADMLNVNMTYNIFESPYQCLNKHLFHQWGGPMNSVFSICLSMCQSICPSICLSVMLFCQNWFITFIWFFVWS